MAGTSSLGSSDRPPHIAMTEIAEFPDPVLESVCQAVPEAARRKLLRALMACAAEAAESDVQGLDEGKETRPSTYEDLVQEAMPPAELLAASPGWPAALFSRLLKPHRYRLRAVECAARFYSRWAVLRLAKDKPSARPATEQASSSA